MSRPFPRTRRIHMVGIGGMGMCGIAEVLLNLGYEVSGSDLSASETTRRLKKFGARIFSGHHSKNVDGVDVVVYSSAVHPDNVEVAAARERQIPVIRRAEMLAELMRMKYGIAVGGTHGKTTTTSLIAAVLAAGNLDPTVVIGGKVNSLGSNAKVGKGDFLVAEADESDGSFLNLSPTIAVVTTLDPEHLDYYRDMEHLQETFLTFINKVPFYGLAVLCLDQEHIRSLLPRVEKRHLTYGFTEKADLWATEIMHQGLGSTFQVQFRGEHIGEVSLRIPGDHNVYNSLAAIAVGLELDIPFKTVGRALGEFGGIVRRFEIKGEEGGVLVVDDYGHHPTEIRATLRAARQVWPDRRLVVLFQPHRYTRTKALLSEFFTAFYDADALAITDIYPAGEPPIAGVDSPLLVEGVRRHGQPEVVYFPRREIQDALPGFVSPGDVLFTLGAGDVWKCGDNFLKSKRPHKRRKGN